MSKGFKDNVFGMCVLVLFPLNLVYIHMDIIHIHTLAGAGLALHDDHLMPLQGSNDLSPKRQRW